MTDSPISRRNVLRTGVGLATGATLAACSDNPSPSTTLEEGRLSPPIHVPYVGVRPDLPSTQNGVPAGYFQYPAVPPRIVNGDIGGGGSVTALLQGAAAPAQKERNRWWQQLDEAMNIDLQVNSVVSTDYGNKLRVSVAGGDFPDLTQIVSLPNLPQTLAKYFVDLSDYLGGDKVKDYPSLAALPPTAWTAGAINGRLYGIAQPRSSAGRSLTVRADIVANLGLDLAVSNGESFLDLCHELTDAKSNRWAFGAQPTGWLVPGVLEMMGGPNKWSNRNGEFTRDIESDLFGEALETVRKMWSEGLIHPDSYAQPAANSTWWLGGRTVFLYQAFEGWGSQQRSNPEIQISAMVPPKWSGGGASIKHLGPGHYIDFVAIRKASDARIKELLRVINYLASPFGTQEYLTVNYGVAGINYNLNGNDPVPTEASKSEKSKSLGYVGGAEFTVLYEPRARDLITEQHEYLTKAIPGGTQNAVLGLFSATQATQGAVADKKINDLQNDIIQGRHPVSDFVAAVNEWRKSVGDKIRSEYQDAFDAAN